MEDQRPYEWAPRRTTLHGREAYEEMRRQSALPPPPSNLAETATFAAAVVVVLALIFTAGFMWHAGGLTADWLIYGLFLEEGGY